MTDVLRVERTSWKERQGTSIGAEPDAAGFYTRLARACSQRGTLRIEILTLDGRPVAHILGVSLAGVYYALKTSYDEAYQAWSPGVVLFEYVIERCFDEGLDTFDFLGRSSRWKETLANDTRSHADACRARPDALRCRWCVLSRKTIKPAVERHAPALIETARRLRIPGR
jgi:CelD/BcsL family acetyltransferase involved in cellulose biosynthesis